MEPLLQIRNISKSFFGIKAHNDISIDFYAGRVHALLGENGAGKSTLIKIISGVYIKDEGRICLEGKEIFPHTPREGIDLGISVIHQELSVVRDLTVAENIFLDCLPTKGKFIDFKKMNSDAKAMMNKLCITNINPTDKMKNLTVADHQMIEIVKAISKNAKVVIMDEPTSSLSQKEVLSLFEVIRTLKKQNVTIIYISHKMDEIKTICDDVSIFKDGNLICSEKVSELSIEQMISRMVGRKIDDYYIKAPEVKTNNVVLRVKNLCGAAFENVSFDLYKGEVLGFAGLVGAGRTELMRAIFGADRYVKGEVYVRGKLARYKHPKNAIKEKIGFVPEERRTQGIFLGRTVKDNIAIASIKSHCKRGFFDRKWFNSIACEYIEKLKIKTNSSMALAQNLSGGNQQKVVLAKWLAAKTDILILDEPTRGIDVNAKVEIYYLIREFVKNGGSVLLVSSELPEIIGVCSRVVVMHEGRVTGVLESKEMTEEIIMQFATSN